MLIRMVVFATRRVEKKGRGKRQRFIEEGVAWQAWNDDARMERVMARLAGSGSFYWPDARAAYRRAIVMFRQDETIHAIHIEGIGAQDVAYLRRANVPPPFGCHPGQPKLIARF